MKVFTDRRVIEGTRGSYRIIEMVKRGGMGWLYKAVDEAGNMVIVKIPSLELKENLEALSYRLKRECRALRLLSHKNIVKYIDEGELCLENGATIPFLVMEYVKGKSLEEMGRLEPGKALDIFKQVADAIAYMHSRGVVHGDIKPRNVIVSERPVIIDFGTATFMDYPTEMREVYLTPKWAAPEHLEMKLFTKQGDIYQLGMLLFYMLTGNCPKDYMVRWELKEEASKVLPRDVKGIYSILRKALSYNLQDRYNDVNELLSSLDEALGYDIIATVEFEGRKYQISDFARIGREEDNEIVIKGPYIHRYHCALIREEGKFYIYQGVFNIVKGRPVRKKVYDIAKWKYNLPHIIRNGRYIPVTDKEELKDGDVIALCYSKRKGPYKILSIKIKKVPRL
ncbi:MAG: hypothetical protein DRJ41_01750 [Thermoprotei archaeon]|nr:MAG: hypothetical protein DRJ41_01750 [Thermoprotei archaeon]